MAEKVIPAEIIKELGEVVKEFPYEATTQDTAALSGCSLAATFMQLLYGGVGAASAWGITSAKPIERYRAFRLAAAVGTGLWAGERSRDASGMACLKLLVALPTALGGEVAALVRERDPYHAVLKNAPKRMDGDPSARIATEQARQSAAQRDAYSDEETPSPSRVAPAGGRDAPSSAPEGDAPIWEFEPAWEPAAADLLPGEQSHPNRRRRRRSRSSSAQHPEEGGGQGEEALKDYFDSRWDEPQGPR